MSNLDKIQAFFAAYARKDVTAVQSVMADDIIWRIPGHHPLAGPKHGIKEAFFDEDGIISEVSKCSSVRSVQRLGGTRPPLLSEP